VGGIDTAENAAFGSCCDTCTGDCVAFRLYPDFAGELSVEVLGGEVPDLNFLRFRETVDWLIDFP
jgi:hypothetical protein